MTDLITRLEEAAKVADHDGYPVLVCPLLLREAAEALRAHPTPIKPSADTRELRERATQIIEAAIERHNPGNSLRHTVYDADAILDLIQSERAGSPIGQNDQPGLAFSGEGEKP